MVHQWLARREHLGCVLTAYISIGSTHRTAWCVERQAPSQYVFVNEMKLLGVSCCLSVNNAGCLSSPPPKMERERGGGGGGGGGGG